MQDVIIIGAGQAALAAAYYLKLRKQISFLLIGKEKNIGDVWRSRYDSLVLFTPRWFSSLPGLPLEGDQNGFATKNEIADYLDKYAQHFDLPIQLNTEVYSLTKEQGIFKILTNAGEYRARKVVVATGPFQKPLIPKFSAGLSNDIFQVHTSQYVSPALLRDGSVLVVGAGNSGAQIAVELCRERDVYLSVGHKIKFFPLQMIGKSIFWWFKKLGVLDASIHSKLGQFLSKQGDPIFGLELKSFIKTNKIKIKARTETAYSNEISFEDGSKLRVQNVIWATGFYSEYSWIQILGVINDKGKPIHNRGVTPTEGLFFLGLPWQYRRGSALIGGVGQDALYVVDCIMQS